MDSNDMWEDHIKGLTKQVAFLLQKTHSLENRIQYYEEVFIILLKALKQGGIIVDDDSGNYIMPS